MLQPGGAGASGISVGPSSGGIYLGNNGTKANNWGSLGSSMFVWSNGVGDQSGGIQTPWGYYPVGLTETSSWRTSNGYGENFGVGGYYCGYVYMAGSYLNDQYHFSDPNCYRSWAF